MSLMARDKLGRPRHFVPKTVIPDWRDVWYRAAFEAAREEDADLLYSDWIRGALDVAAMRDYPVERPEDLTHD